jgi:purine-nucleoside phosphorylase
MTYERAAETAEFIKSKYAKPIKTAVVLGSGLGAFADALSDPIAIPYEQVPHFAQSTVEGHAGRLVLGEVDGVPVAVQQGRFHFYEGYSMDQVTFPMRVFGLMGVENVILTNAAGSLSTEMTPGTLMLISDHINCIGENPLRGANDKRFGPRFPDMTYVYDRELQDVVVTAAEAISRERVEQGLDAVKRDFLHRGVYCGLSGPTYETPAEIHLYRLLGADALGMSTVPEAIVARHQGLRIAGISCITNFGAGMTDDEIDHNHVMETSDLIADVFKELLRRVIVELNSQMAADANRG